METFVLLEKDSFKQTLIMNHYACPHRQAAVLSETRKIFYCPMTFTNTFRKKLFEIFRMIF